jgi:hypothetical protein
MDNEDIINDINKIILFEFRLNNYRKGINKPTKKEFEEYFDSIKKDLKCQISKEDLEYTDVALENFKEYHERQRNPRRFIYT